MRLSPNIYLQSSLIKTFFNVGRKVLALVQQPVVSLAANVEPEELKKRAVMLLDPKPLENYQRDMWVKSGSIVAVDTIKRIHKFSSKQMEFWEDFMWQYINERSLLKTGQMLATQQDVINKAIDRVLAEGMARGMSVPDMRRTITDDLLSVLTEINTYQAERIARTEVNGAANAGSYEGAMSTGVVLGKFWITSGLQGIRESHVLYESLGVVQNDYEYNIGLKHPGDPDCRIAEDIINCRCTIGYEVD
jgi:hypothetical protein